ncbi:unnamed protein product [Acanthoscelides obtectus]|uniref:Uncharacterized protein n=1 Tax=Acanthoscelides obtectus TaxID=200917 RepID=A0A9P0PWL2_ACAOB|nr:unnamed protein product [Acanthoscelides obtectus]CAK1620921.1 Glucocorticoid-induced transcript 1 protein [Acanthoscelides obtectus]
MIWDLGSAWITGKQKPYDSNGGECKVIRRTASLDTIYLKGQWPRDIFYWNIGMLQIDKATQTDDADWVDLRKIHSISELEDTVDKLDSRQTIKGTKDSARRSSPSENTLSSSSQTYPWYVLSPVSKSLPVTLKPLPRSSIRSSVEGLNQEIERIVLRDESGSTLVRPPSGGGHSSGRCSEGRRAPLAEMFHGEGWRSVDTQTPGADERQGSGSSEGSETSSPDQETNRLGSSPQINRFLAREPPDGCEKVQSKSLDEKGLPIESIVAPPTAFKLRPSLGSAFQILQQASPSSQDVSLVPPDFENN